MKKILYLIILLVLLNYLSFSKPIKHIFIIAVDTLRADHIGVYGYYRNTTPNIDNFRKDSVLFENFYTVTPLTTPAFGTMLTSLYPHQHGAKRNGLSLFFKIKTLPYYLKKKGYYTAAFISNWPLRKKLSDFNRDFDEYVEVFNKKRWFGILNKEGTANEVNNRALPWIEKNYNKRFFLWVHYTDPHAPYINHKNFNFEKNKIEEEFYAKESDFALINKYDSEIAFTDFYIGKLIKKLKDLHIYRNSLIIFLADHGESFGEHNYYRHGRKLYNSTLKVPLIIKLPENRLSNTVVKNPVQMVDIVPTIFKEIGSDYEKNFQGISVFDSNKDRILYFETYKGAVIVRKGKKFKRKVSPKKFGILYGFKKLIYNLKSKKYELYDLKRYKFELKNIYKKFKEEIKFEKNKLIEYLKKTLKFIKFTKQYFKQRNTMSKEDVDKLKQLGYL